MAIKEGFFSKLSIRVDFLHLRWLMLVLTLFPIVALEASGGKLYLKMVKKSFKECPSQSTTTTATAYSTSIWERSCREAPPPTPTIKSRRLAREGKVRNTCWIDFFPSTESKTPIGVGLRGKIIAIMAIAMKTMF